MGKESRIGEDEFEPAQGVFYYLESLMDALVIGQYRRPLELTYLMAQRKDPDSERQQWQFVPGGMNGGYYIVERAGLASSEKQDAAPDPWPPDKAVMDIEDWSRDEGAWVITFPAKPPRNAANQHWQLLETATPGYYYIQSMWTYYVLDIYRKGADEPWIDVWGLKRSGYENQAWKLDPA